MSDIAKIIIEHDLRGEIEAKNKSFNNCLFLSPLMKHGNNLLSSNE